MIRVPVLELCEVSITRGRTQILDRVSWRVEVGEHWVILGANGSGKTSLLSALAAYQTPTAGTVEVLGHRFGETDWRELRKLLGIVSSSVRQRIPEAELALITVISGQEAMIEHWGAVSAADRERALEILRSVRCASLAERPWAVLSQGERQRVLIGRALMAGPRVLILDEPCAGLDPVARERFLQFVERLGRQRHAPALVLVTHHIEEIMPVFTHVLALRAGRVLAAGRRKEMLTSEILSKTFGAQMKIAVDGERYATRVEKLSRR